MKDYTNTRAFWNKKRKTGSKGIYLLHFHIHVITTHLLSLERNDWPKLRDMFKARNTNARDREFPVGFPVEVCALNSLFFNVCHNVVARIESRCVIKAKHALLVCWFVRVSTGNTTLALKRSCIFRRAKSNKLTYQQDMCFYMHHAKVGHDT